MATYKVIQDVEAEDKIVGPLTLRQFVYALVACGLGYLCYFLAAHHAGFLAIPFLPVALISGFFAFPWGRDQPTEIWALAKIRFYFKSRRRIWDQSGAKELVTVTAPKKVHMDYTNGLSQVEVKSRLRVLADTLDSRGWAVRNANPNSPNQVVQAIGNQSSDRLVVAAPAPVPIIETDVQDSDDMMDAHSSPIAKQFDNMINASADAHRKLIIDNLKQAAPAAAGPSSNGDGAWFLGQPMQPSVSAPQNAVTFNEQVVSPSASSTGLGASSAAPTDEEEALIKQIEQQDDRPTISYAHLHTIQPIAVQKKMAEEAQKRTAIEAEEARRVAAIRQQTQEITHKAQASVTQPQDTGILDLANNNDLNVATIAREAQKRRPPDEVVISLH